MKLATGEWVNKAEGDWEMALKAYRARKHPVYDAACYHSQQCAEKYLKAYLIFRRVKFPKTHDLEQLLDLIRDFDPLIEAIREPLHFLNPYSVAARYPGDEADRLEAKRALKMAESVRRLLHDRM